MLCQTILYEVTEAAKTVSGCDAGVYSLQSDTREFDLEYDGQRSYYCENEKSEGFSEIQEFKEEQYITKSKTKIHINVARRENINPRKSKQLALFKLNKLVQQSKKLLPFELPQMKITRKVVLQKKPSFLFSAKITKHTQKQHKLVFTKKINHPNTSTEYKFFNLEDSLEHLEQFSICKRKNSLETQDDSEDQIVGLNLPDSTNFTSLGTTGLTSIFSHEEFFKL